MQLELVKSYKEFDIYKNEKHGIETFVVYDTPNDIAREAIRIFVRQDIDINMKIISFRMDDFMAEQDIDFDRMLKIYGLDDVSRKKEKNK